MSDDFYRVWDRILVIACYAVIIVGTLVVVWVGVM